MKKIFFLFISFLISTFSLLSMDQLENYIQQAENAEKSGKKDEALQWYGKAAAVGVPERPPFLAADISYYNNERELQQKGARKIAAEAMKLIGQKKYTEAIEIYKYAGDKFKAQITQIESLQKAQELVQDQKSLIQNLQNLTNKLGQISAKLV